MNNNNIYKMIEIQFYSYQDKQNLNHFYNNKMTNS